MTAEIKQYNEKYKEQVRDVCLDTAGEHARDPDRAPVVLATYCDYYLEHEGEHCFVLADDEDRAVGYILCAPDYRRYRRRFRSDYFPRVKGFAFRCEALGNMLIPALFYKKYPAHLHIDLLADYRHGGMGTRLVNTLCEHLKSIGVPGVMLIVDAYNENARRFYKKCGFEEKISSKTGVVMAKNL